MMSSGKSAAESLRNNSSGSRVRNRKAKMRRLMLESLEDRRLMAVDWRNPVDALDVSGDGFVVPLDALLVINHLNSDEPSALPAQRDPAKPYLDVTGDQFAAPLDVLLIINHLNSGRSGQRKLGEGDKLASESEVVITLGQTAGTRQYRVQLDATFDTTDSSAALEDLLAVYLVDPLQPQSTLLDQGISGSALFTLSSGKAEFQPGRASWDGSVLQLDLSDLPSRQTGLLKFQLLNHDSDNGTQVTIKPLSNQVDVQLASGPILTLSASPVKAGSVLDTARLVLTSSGEFQFGNVRFDSGSGKYQSELRLHNTGSPLGRDVAVAFPDLPAGVTLVSASGRTGDGTPYVNLGPAIPRGGLAAGMWSEAVTLEFENSSQLKFVLRPQLLANSNHAPSLASVAPLNAYPGSVLRVPLVANDPDSDPLSFSIVSESLAGVTGTMKSDGTLEFRPAPDQLGTFQFTVGVSDGALSATQTVTLNVESDPITTTRVSGRVLAVDGAPLASIPVEIGSVRALTGSDGSFTLDLGSGVVVSDTLKVRGELFAGPGAYPFIAEKLALVLEHEVYSAVNNVIDRPIYLPVIDLANGKTIDPSKTTTVTSSALPGAQVVVGAGTLMNQQGTPFTGVLSLTEVPPELTPAALPEGLIPDLVVTIQPGEMVFTRPTPLSLPNAGGYAAGTLLELWSINPVTGQFDNVGLGKVSSDGRVIETIDGGVRNSSWHFFSPPSPTGPKTGNDPRNKKPSGCGASAAATSTCELHSGALVETHALVTYESQGASRGLTLTYDSLRADPRPIVHFTFSELNPNLYSVPDAVRLVAELEVSRGAFSQQVAGFAGGAYGLDGNEHMWRVPPAPGTVDAALQIDLRDQPSGVFDYDLRSGMLGYAGTRGFIGTLNATAGQVTSVNAIHSPLGAGWGIAGVTEIVESRDGSALVIDGNGSEELYTKKLDDGYNQPPSVFATLSKNPDGTFKRVWPDKTVELYNLKNKLATRADRHGNTTVYDYDGAGRLIKVTDPVGLATSFAYTVGSVEITDPVGRKTRLEHDVRGNLTRVVDPDGSSRAWAYDAQHHMVSEVDQLGRVERVEYGFHGRVLKVFRKDGVSRTYAPIDIEGLSRPELTSADPFQLPQTNPVAGRVTNAYSTFADVNGNVTRSSLDAYGQISSSRDGLGPLPSVVRDSNNLPIQTRDTRGLSEWFTYDATGNVLTRSVEVKGGASAFGSALQLDSNDDLVSVADNPALRPANITLEGWVKFDSIPNIAALFGKTFGNARLNSYQVRYQYGELRADISDNADLAGLRFEWQPELGRWHHVAFTFDDMSGRQALYIDGVEVMVRTTTASIAYDSHPFLIGQDIENGVPSFPFRGAIDEVRVWSVARTAAEIRESRRHTLSGKQPGLIAYYQFDSSENRLRDTTPNGFHGTGLSSAQTYIQSLAPFKEPIQTHTGLVSWWTGDGSVTDLVGGNHGLLRTDTTFTAGLAGLAFELPPFRADIARVEIPDAPNGSLNITGDLTINAWIKYMPSWQESTIVEKGPISGNNAISYNLSLAGNNLLFSSRQTGGTVRTVTSPVSIQDNKWTHIAVTIEGSTLQFYVNGVRVGSHQYPYLRPSTSGPLTIGAALDTNFYWSTRLFHGSIDEVQLHDRVLSAEEIKSIVSIDRFGETKPKSFDAVRDFSLHQTSPWEYGSWLTPAGGFSAFTSFKSENEFAQSWYAEESGPSVTRRNSRGGTDDADDLKIHPSNERSGVVQWTAPDAGSYLISGYFEHMGTDTNLAIHLNNDEQSPLFTGEIGGRRLFVPFHFRQTLSAGDRIQFAVRASGFMPSWSDSGAGLSATIVPEGSSSTGIGSLLSSDIATSSFTYDPNFNQVTGYTDQLGRRTQITIDPLTGNTVEITAVVGAPGGADDVTNRMNHTSSGQLASTVDALGRINQYDYDSLGRLTKLRRAVGTPGQTSQSYEYDAAGRLTGFTDENGQRTQLHYDVMNRLVRISKADGSITSMSYDARGNQTSVTNALGQTSRQEFDALDRMVKKVDALENVTRNEYDYAGNLTRMVDPRGATTRFQYDARNRLIATIDSIQGVTRFAYDADGRLLSLTDANGNSTRYEHDTLGRLVAERDSLGNVTEYAYSIANELIAVTDRLKRVTQFEYDAVGRLTTEKWLNADQSLANTIEILYDSASRVTEIKDNAGQFRFTYDDLNRAIREQFSQGTTHPSVVLDFAYDAVGNRTSVSDLVNGQTGATQTYRYDALNRLTELLQSGDGVATKGVSFQYNANHQLISMLRHSGVVGQGVIAKTTYTYDVLSRLTQIKHADAADQSLNRFNYQYDAASRLTRVEDIDGATSYTYDSRDRLIGATHADPAQAVEKYSYDAAGNRRSSGNNLYTSTANNRLSRDGEYQYEYDAEGNRTKRTRLVQNQPTGEVTTYQWDHRNRLTRVTIRASEQAPVGSVVSYVYDAQNRRIASHVDKTPADSFDGSITYYLHDGDNVFADWVDPDGSGPMPAAEAMRYLHGIAVDEVLAQEDAAGTVLWNLTDHLGTVRDQVDGSGKVVNHLKYDSYGNLLSQSNEAVTTRYRFTGREFDSETGMQFNRARYYDASIGQFISEDPSGYRGGLNFYAYAENSPIAFRDPRGLSPEDSQTLTEAQFRRRLKLRDNRAQTVEQIVAGLVDKMITDGYVLDGGRYLCTGSGKWLDLVHFFKLAQFSLRYGIGPAWIAGWGNEALQFIKREESGAPFGGNEDLFSNTEGAIFGANINNALTLEENLMNYINANLGGIQQAGNIGPDGDTTAKDCHCDAPPKQKPWQMKGLVPTPPHAGETA